VVWGYDLALGAGKDVGHARAMAIVCLVIASAAITAGLSRLRTMSARVIVSSSVLSTIVLVQVPPIAALIHLQPLHASDWAVAAAGGLLAGVLASGAVNDPLRRRIAAPSADQ
jgi:Ca2+-transporting ATPase